MVKRSNPGWSQRLSATFQSTMPESLKMGMERVEQEAKRIVYLGHPDHLEKKTGRLQQSITTIVTTEGYDITASTGTSVPYAPAHEFGAVIPHKNGRVSVIPPRPFLLPAFETKKAEVIKQVHEDVRNIIRSECHD